MQARLVHVRARPHVPSAHQCLIMAHLIFYTLQASITITPYDISSTTQPRHVRVLSSDIRDPNCGRTCFVPCTVSVVHERRRGPARVRDLRCSVEMLRLATCRSLPCWNHQLESSYRGAHIVLLFGQTPHHLYHLDLLERCDCRTTVVKFKWQSKGRNGL